MKTPKWKFWNADRVSVHRVLPDGTQESALITRPDIMELIEQGKVLDPDVAPEAPQATKEELIAKVGELAAQIEALPDDAEEVAK